MLAADAALRKAWLGSIGERLARASLGFEEYENLINSL